MASSQKDCPMVVGIGELLWDILPGGRELGGAPANFAYHAHNLGAKVAVISRVGKDTLGREALARFEAIGLPVEAVQIDDSVPTGTAEVKLDAAGSPQFFISDNVAWDRLAVEESALAAVRRADALCFGSLAQRDPIARKTIRQLVAAAPADSLRVFDVNLRQRFYSREVVEASLQLTNVLKLNDHELPLLAEMFDISGHGQNAVEKLAARFHLRAVALTRGAGGSLIYCGGQWSERKPESVTVVDTVGAGDSFSAAFVTGLLMKMSLEQIHELASQVAAYVCSQPGAMPSLPSALSEKISCVTNGSELSDVTARALSRSANSPA